LTFIISTVKFQS